MWKQVKLRQKNDQFNSIYDRAKRSRAARYRSHVNFIFPQSLVALLVVDLFISHILYKFSSACSCFWTFMFIVTPFINALFVFISEQGMPKCLQLCLNYVNACMPRTWAKKLYNLALKAKFVLFQRFRKITRFCHKNSSIQ